MSKKASMAKPQQDSKLTLTREEFSGPIPPPVVLEQYKNILPSAPDRIIIMAEKQQNHEHVAIIQALTGEVALKNKGQLYGFLFIVLISFLSAYALFLGYEKFAIMGMIFVAVPLVKVFILGSKSH